jgi:exoribonuclease R
LRKDGKIYYKKSDDTYNIKTNVELIGTFFETKQDYGFVETEDGESFFVPAKFVSNALHGDTVKFLVLPSMMKGKGDVGKISRVMKRNGSNIVGEVVQDGEILKINPFDNASKHDYVIKNTQDLIVGDVVIAKFIDYIDHKILVKVIENLGVQTADND